MQQEKSILEFCQVLPWVAIAILPGNWQISAQNSSAPYTSLTLQTVKPVATCQQDQ
jgi:hypothetical protein